jgi:beta-galactosidase
VKRRDFLKTTGALIAGAAVATDSFADHLPGNGAALPEGRLILPINRNWRYHPASIEGAQDKAFDDSGWDRVVLPHANIKLPWHNCDEKAYQFISSYRRRFKLPAEARGRRVFVDFEGVMTASTVWLNGTLLGEYEGGYTPFSFDLTPHLDDFGENVLAVKVDSTERADIPPFGYQIDYLTFGGIYREVSLRIVDATFLDNIFARPLDVLSGSPSVDVDCHIRHAGSPHEPLTAIVELRDGDRVVSKATQNLVASDSADETSVHTIRLSSLGAIELWDLAHPKLYEVHVSLYRGKSLIDQDSRRIGFRHAEFTDHGFDLNGKTVKLRGLNRHQTFPFVGAAMPRRVQRKDAEILRKQFKCNIVRTSHYPQSRHFLDACDEYGLLVLEEIPGWQHIGDAAWKQLAVDNVSRMIRRDWNHPSIILWGVRINESSDDHDFYAQTNAMAHRLDTTRQTGGIRAFAESEWLEDVFTVNDFGFPLRAPNHPRYLNTEFVGHTYNTKSIDNADRLIEHTLRHVRVHDQLASNPQYSGGIAWCAFDYNTHNDFGSGDGICYHGVADIFREPKPAAGFYRSQCDPSEEIILEPAFHWAPSDEAGGLDQAVICSNCDHIQLYVAGKLAIKAEPDRKSYSHLRYPPFIFAIAEKLDGNWGDMRLEGYIEGKKVITRNYSGKDWNQKFVLIPDDTKLIADGADTTRVVFRITDEFGNVRPFADEPIQFEIEGPAELIGDLNFPLPGGAGAIWIRAKESAGRVHLKASHPRLGTQQIEIDIAVASPELA